MTNEETHTMLSFQRTICIQAKQIAVLSTELANRDLEELSAKIALLEQVMQEGANHAE